MLNVNKHRLFSLLHRGLGAAVALFVVILAVTGLLLNHTSELGLKQKHLHLPWLNQLYGLHVPTCTAAYAVDAHWLSLWDGRVFWDTQALDIPISRKLYGAFVQDGILLVANAEQLSLLTMQGELVDRMDYPAQRTPVRAGRLAQRVVLEFVDSSSLESPRVWLRLNEQMTALETAQAEADAVVWAEEEALPEALRSAIAQHYQGEGITLERLALDMHSGRLAGRIGVYVMDAAAVGMLLLVVSGSALLWIRRRKTKLKPLVGELK